jgi:uncharacterized Zn finger protein
MAYFSYFKPYVSVAQRRASAARTVSKMMKGGQKPQPVEITGRKITETFWGNAWCDNLERYSDYENRLPRGKTYARNGSVVHLEIHAGRIEAMVQGSDLYDIEITISTLSKARWTALKQECTGKISNLLDLIQGKLPKDLLLAITNKETGIFPSPKEIELSCSCPDGAYMCKHVAAVLYGVGNRLDRFPDLFFTLRSLDIQELLTSAGTHTTGLADTGGEMGADDLADIFGIEIEGMGAAPSALPTPVRPVRAKKAVSKTKPAPAKKLAPPSKPSKKTATAKKVVSKPVRKPARKAVKKAASLSNGSNSKLTQSSSCTKGKALTKR